MIHPSVQYLSISCFKGLGDYLSSFCAVLYLDYSWSWLRTEARQNCCLSVFSLPVHAFVGVLDYGWSLETISEDVATCIEMDTLTLRCRDYFVLSASE